ncbi:rhomboid family intramembrane serine protease [Kitasatospora camelliae]|uniref:Rhomboid family intramembrane serine protease n=1 Tax=Kitasatospora camelliae TaxID=3156397 RepID=A0AAU8K5I5_9ACTN
MDATPAADGARDTHAPDAQQPPTCYRHTGRETYVRCTRCDRYVCPDCMREAAVGYHCPDCVKEGRRGMRQARTVFGGRPVGTPVATYLLIALNVLAYLATVARPALLDRFDMLGRGMVAPDGGYYLEPLFGVPEGFQAVGVAHGEWFRLLTGAFLHQLPTVGLFGIAHILFNMYWVWTLGGALEERLGRIRFVALYLLSALGGSVLSYLVSPDQPAVGASGAVFGLVAGYFVLSRKLRHDPLGGSRMLVTSLIWLVVSAGFTSWEGHLGGLLTGAVVGAAYAFAPRRGRTAVQAAAAVAVLAVLVGLTVLKTSDLTAGLPTGI